MEFRRVLFRSPVDPEAAEALRDGRAGEAAGQAGPAGCRQPAAGGARPVGGTFALTSPSIGEVGPRLRASPDGIARMPGHSLIAAAALSLAACSSVASSGDASGGNSVIADGST